MAGSCQGFLGLDRVVFLLFFCSDKGPHGVVIVFFFSTVTMSRQRFPCCDRDGRGNRPGLR